MGLERIAKLREDTQRTIEQVETEQGHLNEHDLFTAVYERLCLVYGNMDDGTGYDIVKGYIRRYARGEES